MPGPAEPAPAADFTPPDQETLREDYLRSQQTVTSRDKADNAPSRYYTGSGMEDLDEFLQELENREKPKGHWYYKSPQPQPGAARLTAEAQQELLRRKVEAAVQTAARARELPASRLGCALVEGAIRTSNTRGGTHESDGLHTAVRNPGIDAGDMPSLLQQVLSTVRPQDKKVHPETSEAQGVLRKYRGVLRVQGRLDHKAAAAQANRLAGARSMVREHGLWLGSFSDDGGERRTAPFGDREERASYMRQMADAYDVPPPPDTAFRRGKGAYTRPGIRASVDPARDAGRVVRRLGSLLAVCQRDFEAERRVPSQALLTRSMAGAARAEQLRFHLRPRLLLCLVRAMQSPANPPSIANVNIARLHNAWQASAAHNPQPWVLGRAQLVGLLLSSVRHVSSQDAHRLVSCYDLSCRDHVRFAEVSCNLLAALPPAQLLLQSLPTDIGPYRLALTALRQMFRLYAQVSGGVLRYGTLLELLRSCTASVAGIAALDDAVRLFLTDMGRSLKDSCSEETLVQQLTDQLQLHQHPPPPTPSGRRRGRAVEGEGLQHLGGVSGCLVDVFQQQLQAFQALVATHAEEHARQRLLEASTIKPSS